MSDNGQMTATVEVLTAEGPRGEGRQPLSQLPQSGSAANTATAVGLGDGEIRCPQLGWPVIGAFRCRERPFSTGPGKDP